MFPFTNYPYKYYGYYPKYQQSHSFMQHFANPSNENTIVDTSSSTTKCSDRNESKKNTSKSSPFTFNLDGFTSNDEAVISLFGIELYLDDLIILGLLYILYQEKVKDDMLFICLLLLLLS